MTEGEKLEFTDKDRIAVIAPHPDDECLGASAALLLAPSQTDIFVLTDGSRGFKERSFEEEAAVRRAQFEAEMQYVRPHSYMWLGCEDTKMSQHPEIVRQIDFTPYTIIFLPWSESFHPDLNAFRGAQLLTHPEKIYAEAYLRVDEDSYPEQSLAACLKRV